MVLIALLCFIISSFLSLVSIAHAFRLSIMSAIPNLPEEVVRVHPTDPDAALRQLLNGKGSVSHVEHAHTNGEVKTNGVHDTEPEWLLHDTPIENQRPIKVIVIGAGYSGVYLGIRIPERLRNCELTIYEKNAGIGGTW